MVLFRDGAGYPWDHLLLLGRADHLKLARTGPLHQPERFFLSSHVCFLWSASPVPARLIGIRVIGPFVSFGRCAFYSDSCPSDLAFSTYSVRTIPPPQGKYRV